jgi:hypothetical protein
MNKTTESDIYKLIKKAVVNLKLNCHLIRIESGLTISGIPDLHIVYYSNQVNKSVSFWVELKSNNLKNCNLSKYQINWILTFQLIYSTRKVIPATYREASETPRALRGQLFSSRGEMREMNR